jgi:glutamate-1-semialdehyde aminotransferase
MAEFRSGAQNSDNPPIWKDCEGHEIIDFYKEFGWLLLGGRSFPADNALRKRQALAAFRTPTKAGVNLCRTGRAIAQGVLQILFPNRIADANNHASLLFATR